MNSTSVNVPNTLVSDRQRIFAIVRASFGNLLEWAQFYFYAFATIYFAPSFFPGQNPTIQLLQSAGIFSAGFLARPIGGWFYGRLADQKGRRQALIHSGMIMFLGSLLLTVLPTYASVGYLAPTLLLCARLLQGFSVGGGYSASATYMSEVSIKNQRGFLGSFQYSALIGGQLIAALVIALLQQLLSDAQLKAWGWRIPFALGTVGALISIWIRLSLKETATQKDHRKKAGTIRQLMQYKRGFMTVFLISAAGSLSFYTFTVYMQKYLIHSLQLSPTIAMWIMTSCLFICMLLQPIFGALSDRIGRLTPMIAFSSLMVLFTIPAFHYLHQTTNVYMIFVILMSILTILSLYTSIGGLIKAELFPKEVRALGVGLSYGIANALFGGTAETIALWTKAIDMEFLFYWYITAMCFASLFVSIRYLPQELAKNYLEQD